MILSAETNEMSKLMQSIYERGYSKGRIEALNSLFETAKNALNIEEPNLPEAIEDNTAQEINGRQRAPRGSVEKVVKRAIEKSESGFITADDAFKERHTEEEKMIAYSSIQTEFKRGLEVSRYILSDGRYGLPNTESEQ